MPQEVLVSLLLPNQLGIISVVHLAEARSPKDELKLVHLVLVLFSLHLALVYDFSQAFHFILSIFTILLHLLLETLNFEISLLLNIFDYLVQLFYF